MPWCMEFLRLILIATGYAPFPERSRKLAGATGWEIVASDGKRAAVDKLLPRMWEKSFVFSQSYIGSDTNAQRAFVLIKLLLRFSEALKRQARKLCKHNRQFLFNGEIPACPDCGGVGRDLK